MRVRVRPGPCLWQAGSPAGPALSGQRNRASCTRFNCIIKVL
jgi:hypothetical protein